MAIDKLTIAVYLGMRGFKPKVSDSVVREMTTIIDFVEECRAQYNIKPTPGIKFELSDDGFGEGYNLLYRQLVLTTNGKGDWSELRFSKIRSLVLEEIWKSETDDRIYV